MQTKTFDTQHALLLDTPEVPPVTVNGYVPLAAAITSGDIHPLEPCLVAELDHRQLVLPTLALVYHHVAQGRLEDTPWLVVFCCLCNAGAVFDPRVNETAYTFAAQGYYELMVLIADQETRSFWNHLTGECLYGELAGAALHRRSTLQQMRAGDASSRYPDARLVQVEPLASAIRATAERWNTIYRLAEQPAYGEGLLSTLIQEDARLPRHDMGLGVWTATTQRYYPLSRLYAQQYAIVDQLDGRGVVLVFNEDIGLPEIFYADADQVAAHGNEFILDTHRRYSNGILYVDGQPTRPERPHHNAIRWYGFSSIFPECEIYAGNQPAR